MFHGRHALQNQMTMEALGSIGQWWQVLIVIITTAIGVMWWVYRKYVNRGIMAVAASIVLVLGIYLSLDGVYNPTVLNVKSIKGECPNIDRAAPIAKGKLYEYMEVGVKAKGDPAHFFEVNFYLGNRIGSFHIEKPQKGFLLISEDDYKLNEKQFASTVSRNATRSQKGKCRYTTLRRSNKKGVGDYSNTSFILYSGLCFTSMYILPI